MERGLKGNTPLRIGHSASEVITGSDARHPNPSQQRCTKKDPGRTAKKMWRKKPASCHTCEAWVRVGGHSAKCNCSLRRSYGGAVTVSASVSTNQPSTSRRVSQLVILLADNRGRSDAPRTPNKRKWSDANDCIARIQPRSSGHHCTSTRMALST